MKSNILKRKQFRPPQRAMFQKSTMKRVNFQLRQTYRLIESFEFKRDAVKAKVTRREISQESKQKTRLISNETKFCKSCRQDTLVLET